MPEACTTLQRVDPVTDMYQKQLDLVEHDLVSLA
jgi:hypothetical protein